MMEAELAVPLSADLRLRLVRAVEEGSSARRTVARFEVSAPAAIGISASKRPRPVTFTATPRSVCLDASTVTPL